jgi:hypothetical protein
VIYIGARVLDNWARARTPAMYVTQYSRAFRNLISIQHLDTAASARLAAMSSVIFSDAITACLNAKHPRESALGTMIAGTLRVATPAASSFSGTFCNARRLRDSSEAGCL